MISYGKQSIDNDDIQSIIDTNQQLTKEEKPKRFRNFFSRKAPQPSKT